MLPEAQLIDCLKQTSLAEGLSDAEVGYLSKAGTTQQVAADATIIQEGDRSDAAIVLLQGAAAVFKGNLEGNPYRIREITAGETLGEIGILLNTPRTCSVRTTQPSVFFILTRPVLESLIDDQQRLGGKLCFRLATMMGHRIDQLTQETVKLLEQNDRLLETIDCLQTNSSEEDMSRLQQRLVDQAQVLRMHQSQVRLHLQLEIDETKRKQQVQDIVSTTFFQELQVKARDIRKRDLDSFLEQQ